MVEEGREKLCCPGWFDISGLINVLTAEIAVRVRLHVLGQIFADSGPVGIGDAKPLQLRRRLSDALARRL